MKVKGIICLVIFLGIAVQSCAQDYFNYLSARFNQGYILIHSRDLRAIENSYPFGLEFDLGRHKTSQRVWNNCNCYPKTGVSIAFWDFDNRDVLGYGITSMYYVQPVFGAGNKFSFSVRGAMGFSYQSNPYHEKTNPDNLSYSTRIAFPLQVGLAAHYRVGETWLVDLNAVFNHISNGGLKDPNKGINWPTVSLGVSRYFQVPVFPERKITNWRADNPELNRWDLSVFSTYHKTPSDKFLISAGFEAKYARRISRLDNITGGIEWMYDNGQAKLAAEDRDVNGNNFGLAIGHEFILGKFLFGQQFAAYLINPETQPADVYQRYSLVYRITPGFSAGVSLKSHGHVAEFVDVRIGLNF